MPGIHATGFVGIAFEATAGTYVAPTKFFPIRSESLSLSQEVIERRVIRGIADVAGVVQGNFRIEGDIEMEILHDVLPYFMYASRNTVVRTGAAAPYTYTGTPFHGAVPTTARTLSITVVRNGMAFGYVGCVVGSMSFTTDGGLLIGTFSIVGRDEASQTVPSAPTFTTVGPFADGMYTIGSPTGTTILDVSNFTLSIEDNAAPEFRLSTSRGASYVRFGERAVQLTMTRDFDARAEYDEFKAMTARSVRIGAVSGAHSIQFTVPATIKTAYEISGLSAQGDLVTAEITYSGTFDPTTSKAYELVVVTTEAIT